MKSENIKSLVATAGICSAILLSQSAFAGHTNTVLEAELDGREEVDDNATSRALVGDGNGKGEAYVFGIDGDLTTLCYSLIVEKIQLVPVGEGIAAHIHEGDRDSNGPVVAVLAGPEDGNAADCLTEGETGKFPTAEPGIVQRILENPTSFYINVHNPEFPAGAIRGNLQYQLEEDHSHDMDSDTNSDTPSVPMNLSGVVFSRTSAELYWDRSTDNGLVVAYIVYRDGVQMRTVEGPSFFDNTLDRGTSFSYTVSSVDDQGNQSAESAPFLVTP